MTASRFGLGVYVCVFNKDFSKILLVKRNEEKRKKYGADWGNIGGSIEFGETSIDAALREIKEEICLELKKEQLRWIMVRELPNFSRDVHGIGFVYATRISENSKICINEEADDFKWFPINELPDKMIDSREEIKNILEKSKNGL